MARINWNGSEIEATVVEQLVNGNYRMMAKAGAPRIEAGTIVEVEPKHIISLDIGGAIFPMPGAVTTGLGPQFQVPASAPSNEAAEKVSAADLKANSPANVSTSPMSMIRKTPLLNGLRGKLDDFMGQVEAAAGALHAKMESDGSNAVTNIGKIVVVVDAVSAIAKDIGAAADEALATTSNGGPPLGNSETPSQG